MASSHLLIINRKEKKDITPSTSGYDLRAINNQLSRPQDFL